MRIVFFLLFYGIIISSFAQQETANWFLKGNHIRVTPGGISNGNFNGQRPPFEARALSTSVSDAAGNLLFACDGGIVVDRNFQPMPGLSANISAQGSNLIALQVPNSTRYYIFYTTRNDYIDINASFTNRYLLIDMQFNGGKGAVVEEGKIIDPDGSAGFTTVEDNLSGKCWLVIHANKTGKFKAYEILSTGLNTTPVISDAGIAPVKERYIVKQLKTSPNGKMIAGIVDWIDRSSPFYGGAGWIEVFKFDGQTGIVINQVFIDVPYGYSNSFHSVEFSPDNRLLYGGFMSRVAGLQPCGYGSSQVRQYNLCYTNSGDIVKYGMLVSNRFAWCYPQLTWGRMQLGADKKIHLNYVGHTLSGIVKPNRIGTSAEVLYDEYPLAGQGNSEVPIPGFHHQVLEKATKNNIVYNGACFPSMTSFSVTNDTISSVAWHFGDALSTDNTVNELNPDHKFSSPGIFRVTADLYNRNGNLIETLNELVEIKDPAKRLLYEYPEDTTVCSGQGVMLKLNVINGIFHWYYAGADGIKHSMGTADSMYVRDNFKYFVEMRQNDCNGCIRWDSINLTVLPVPRTSLGYDKTICFGDSVLLSVSDVAAHYNWSDGTTGMSVVAKSAGEYWVRSEYNNNGCPMYDTVKVSVNPDISFEFGKDTVLCAGQQLLLSPAVPGTSPVWQDGSYNSTYRVTKSGKYFATIWLNGCRKSDTINVSYVNAEAVSLGPDTLLCEGELLNLKPIVTNATMLWNDGSTGASLIVSQAGKYWLRVSYGSCVVTDTISVGVTQKPALSLGADTTLCEGQSLILNPGIPGADYKWQDGSINQSYKVSSPGAKWVSLRKGGCLVNDTIMVLNKPAPKLNLGSDISVCADSAVLLDATDLSIDTYRWQNNHHQPTLLVTRAGQYTVRATGYNGCFRDDTIMVLHKQVPYLSLGNDTVICDNRELRYSFRQPATNYQWSNGSTGGSNVINRAGLYWLQSSLNGCIYRDSIQVTTINAPNVYLGNDTAICESDAILLDAGNDGERYLWNTGSSSSSLKVSRQGIYIVQVSGHECITSDTIRISSLKSPQFNLGKDTSLCDGQMFLIGPSGIEGNFRWQDGTRDRHYAVKTPGVYKLTVANSCGSNSDEIVVTRGVCQFVIPNAFTPNNDNNNDIFRVKNHGFIAKFEIRIYNRWGQVIYSSVDPSRGWDGKQNSLLSPEGNYNWIIVYTDRLGNTETKYGSVLLIR